MLTKFEKYWKDFSLILAIAIVLDSRHKLNFVDYAYGNVYGMKGSPQFLEVKRNLELLFTEYSKGKVSTINVVTSLPTPIAKNSAHKFLQRQTKVLKEFNNFES
ncbi:zinc finger BED domain-containing protein RICESLEEPER 1-like [Morus notabilis]|uniref:zinc finger BED domain-containing protein RICESLEEPER 1-like n=1 Tax=Morus notabilis TaxID=981085 RepID=UPI000CED6BD6|nr:zinc finger BED domain-containing protein RICESLEEPER 1-like [Morus notabilis]